MFDKYYNFIEKLKPGDKFLFMSVFLVLIGSILYSLLLINNNYKTSVPTYGGTLIEGIIGIPRFANPVLAITHADQDVTSLVYSSLLSLGEDGSLQPDIAESVTISEDGLTYNIKLKPSIIFHDNVPLTAEDVAFTIRLIQNPTLKSPLRGNWNDVEVEIVNKNELNFILQEPYTPFIQNLTVGILPKHIWGELSVEQLPFSQNNTEPIGSGPYSLDSVEYNKSGLIDSYSLKAFNKNGKQSKISAIKLRFFQNEKNLIEAFDNNELSSTASLPYEKLNNLNKENFKIIQQSLPRVFSVFFNQNKSVSLRDKNVRKALDIAIDRDKLIEDVLSGFGVPTVTPVPPGFLDVDSIPTSKISNTEGGATSTNNILQAKNILIDAGWKQQKDNKWQKEIDDEKTKLSITITTSNTEVFKKTAEFVKSAWEELGVEVNLAIFEQSDLIQVIIRPRNYEALLFGVDVGRSLDLYPFWHSSQKDDPGLNISLYTNITTDNLLKTARTTQDNSKKTQTILAFEKEIMRETPSIFLYSPSFTYVVRNNVVVPSINKIVRSSERFSRINLWHIKESDVWPIFTN